MPDKTSSRFWEVAKRGTRPIRRASREADTGTARDGSTPWTATEASAHEALQQRRQLERWSHRPIDDAPRLKDTRPPRFANRPNLTWTRSK